MRSTRLHAQTCITNHKYLANLQKYSVLYFRVVQIEPRMVLLRNERRK